MCFTCFTFKWRFVAAGVLRVKIAVHFHVHQTAECDVSFCASVPLSNKINLFFTPRAWQLTNPVCHTTTLHNTWPWPQLHQFKTWLSYQTSWTTVWLSLFCDACTENMPTSTMKLKQPVQWHLPGAANSIVFIAYIVCTILIFMYISTRHPCYDSKCKYTNNAAFFIILVYSFRGIFTCANE